MFQGTPTYYDRDGAGFTTKGNLIATYPSGIVAGELLVMLVHRASGGATLSGLDGGAGGVPAGWHGSGILSGTTNNQMDVLYKEATGLESGTFTLTTTHGWALFVSRMTKDLSAITRWQLGAASSVAAADNDMKFQLIGDTAVQITDGNVVSGPDDLAGDLIPPEDRGQALDVYWYGWGKNPGPPDDPTITDVFPTGTEYITYTYWTPTTLSPKRTKNRDLLVLHPRGLLGENAHDSSSRIVQNGSTNTSGGASGNVAVRAYLYRDNDTELDVVIEDDGPISVDLRLVKVKESTPPYQVPA